MTADPQRLCVQAADAATATSGTGTGMLWRRRACASGDKATADNLVYRAVCRCFSAVDAGKRTQLTPGVDSVIHGVADFDGLSVQLTTVIIFGHGYLLAFK